MKPVFYIRAFLVLLFFTGLVSIKAQSKEIKVKYINPGTVDMNAFKLSTEGKIKISGKGALLPGYDDEYVDSKGTNRYINENTNFIVYGWILNSSTRSVVWSVKEKFKSASEKPKGIFSFNEEITLKPGEYEVYFTGMFDFENGINFNNNWWRQIFSIDSDNYKRRDLEGLGLTLSAPASLLSETNIEGVVDRYNSRAVVNLIRAGDSKNLNKGFSLKAETKLKVYALGEAQDESSYDYAWIYNVKNNKKVWDLNYRVSKHAGGADKNVLFNDVITLPKGSYMVRYTTDDSHSFEAWNSLPPDDPQFWGITINAASEKDLANITQFNEADIVKPIIELVKVGDDDFRSQGFKLNKDSKLRVLVIGEGFDDEMADMGWIIDADTRKTVWQMKYDDTEHAGGAEKNRMIDLEITLKQGNYIAYYSTDDSHSYFEWNAAAPFDKDKYGITIWTVDETDAANVSLFNEKDYKSQNVIAEIVRVKDNDFESRDFLLDKETKINIYALGEGIRSSMADYGWIEEDATGKTVWEMRYKKTSHAGGADKNRVVSEVITLAKGKYRLYYETDNSHSYKDWNSSPPDDQERYGITLTYEK